MLDFILILIISLIAFGIILALVFNALGYGKCQHSYEKIIDTCGKGGCGKVVVHICTKCGKRKVTKV